MKGGAIQGAPPFFAPAWRQGRGLIATGQTGLSFRLS